MSKLSADEFMNSVKELLGDRDDDIALKFLEDCKDTIAGEKDDYKEKYETAIKEKEALDKEWRTKYKERFYSSDTNSNNPKDKDKNEHEHIMDERSDEQKKAESISINDLFKPADK